LGDCWPDITILLDLPVKLGMQRIRARAAGETIGLDRMEREAEAFHIRVSEGFQKLAQKHPARFHVVDASASYEEVQRSVYNALFPWIPELGGVYDG
jgi:dTMP kinase